MNSQKSHDEEEEEVIILMQNNRQNMSSAYEQEYSRDLLKKIKLAGDRGLNHPSEPAPEGGSGAG